jgi:very-short-patch-repair endonuclease
MEHTQETKIKIGQFTKGKTYEERYGPEKAAQVKEKLSRPKSDTSNMKGFCGHHSNETKKKISIAGKGRKPPITGKHHSEESKEKMRQRKIGHIPWNKGLKGVQKVWNKGLKNCYNEEIKKQMSNTWKNKYKEGFIHPMFGKKHNESTRQKMKLKRNQRVMPMRDTKIELKIQKLLTDLKIEFYHHYYTSEITHAYQCDMFIPIQKGINQKTIIECDGDWWHCNPLKFPNPSIWQKEQIKEDKIRTKELIEKGFRVIRLWETDINNLNLKGFEQIIWS